MCDLGDSDRINLGQWDFTILLKKRGVAVLHFWGDFPLPQDHPALRLSLDGFNSTVAFSCPDGPANSGGGFAVRFHQDQALR
jgi:hypothetical protein